VLRGFSAAPDGSSPARPTARRSGKLPAVVNSGWQVRESTAAPGVAHWRSRTDVHVLNAAHRRRALIRADWHFGTTPSNVELGTWNLELETLNPEP